MEEKISVAIIGLGRVGSVFIEKLKRLENREVFIKAAYEENPDSPGLTICRRKAIRTCSDISEITEMGSEIDIIFNLTGDMTVERNLRLAQVKSRNHHTVSVSRIIAALLWKAISDGALPEHSGK